VINQDPAIAGLMTFLRGHIPDLHDPALKEEFGDINAFWGDHAGVYVSVTYDSEFDNYDWSVGDWGSGWFQGGTLYDLAAIPNELLHALSKNYRTVPE